MRIDILNTTLSRTDEGIKTEKYENYYSLIGI
jgi:hypothetical protein